MTYTLDMFSKEFKDRHDFGDDDLMVLQNNHPTVRFESIPTAWIMVLDQMLMGISEQVRCVSQYYGQMVVFWKGKPTDKAFRSVKLAERKLYMLDEDLHQRLSYG